MSPPSDEWVEILDDFQNIWGPDATAVGRHRMVLGERNPVTGWPQISYEETEVDVIVINRESVAKVGLPIGGTYVRLAAIGYAGAVWRNGDRLIMLDGTGYRVQSVIPLQAGNTILLFILDLDEMPLKEW